jgi:hypothetical protein
MGYSSIVFFVLKEAKIYIEILGMKFGSEIGKKHTHMYKLACIASYNKSANVV